MFWDYAGPKAGKAGSAAPSTKANGAAQKVNGVQADGAFGTTMSPEFKVCRAGLLRHCCDEILLMHNAHEAWNHKVRTAFLLLGCQKRHMICDA